MYENILDKYDVIITNPPIKAGKKVILEFLINAKIHLNDGGRLWFVMRKDQGAKSIQKLLNEHYNVELEYSERKCEYSEKNEQCIKERCPFYE